MSHISEVSSMTSFRGMMMMDDDTMIDGDDQMFEAMLEANEGNNKAIQFLQKGQQLSKAWTCLEQATKAAMKLIAPPSSSPSHHNNNNNNNSHTNDHQSINSHNSHNSINHNNNNDVGATNHMPLFESDASSDQQLQHHQDVNISIIRIPGSSNISNASFVLRQAFLMDDSSVGKNSKEVLVAVILYNLAFLLHLRGMEDAGSSGGGHHHPSLKQTNDLHRAMRMYQMVIQLSRGCVRLEHPVLTMAALNNLGQIHHMKHEYDAMRDCWSQLATLIVDLPPSFSLLNVRTMQLNIQMKDRLDPTMHPAKKQRSI